MLQLLLFLQFFALPPVELSLSLLFEAEADLR